MAEYLCAACGTRAKGEGVFYCPRCGARLRVVRPSPFQGVENLPGWKILLWKSPNPHPPASWQGRRADVRRM